MKSNKKAFTIVELVIVIAVIAILAAVLIPTFSNMIKRSKVSADQQLIRNLNSALKADLKDHNTMTDALAAAAEFGYDVSKINKSATDNEILWDSKNDAFCYFESDKNQITYIPGTDKTVDSVDAVDYWVIAKAPSDKYSTYLYGYEGAGELTITKGLDVGKETSITKVSYVRTTGATQNVKIRTNGGELIVNAPNDNVYHYGDADSVNIIAVASTSYHENGTVPFIQISKGRIEIEATADVNGIHIANVQTMDANFSITRNTEEFSHDVTVTLNGKEVKLSRDKIGTNLSSAVLVCKVEATAGASEYIWLVGDGTLENAKVYVTDSITAPNTEVASTTNPGNASKAAIAIANNLNGNDAEDSGKTAEEAEAASALKGSGTEDDPFLIYDYATMQKISDFYDKGYYYFEVALDKTDNGKIDCTGWIPVYLHGSFDGKGVKFTNVTAVLFQTVGYQLQNENIVLKNFDATMNVSSNGQYGAAALIKNIFNAGTTTFSNVNVHGYLEGFWNMGSFYNYGTANYDGKGCNYEVVFNDCYSDATLVCASGNTIGGLFGHSFEGSGNSFTLRVNNTEYAGQMFLTTSSGKGNKYFGMTSDYNNAKNHFYFDGVEDTFDNGSNKNAGAYTNSVKITRVDATKEANGYVIAKQANVSKIVVTITAQLTAYDSNNNQIANSSGITMTLSSLELTELDGSSIKVLDLFNSINISKNASTFDAGVSNNILNISLASSANYKSGTIRLQVNQYDSTGSIVSAGTLDVATCENATSEWVVK